MMVLSKIPPRTELKINLYNVQNAPEYIPNVEYKIQIEIVDYLDRQIVIIIEDILGINIIPPIMVATLVP